MLHWIPHFFSHRGDSWWAMSSPFDFLVFLTKAARIVVDIDPKIDPIKIMNHYPLVN